MKRWMQRPSAASADGAPIVPAAAADKVVLMLNWYVYGEHAPFYYGKAKGIYAAEGIDLEIQEGRGSAATTQAVAAKTADFGYVDVPTMMRAAVKGAPVIATGVLLQTSPMSVMGFADKNIRKPEDIKGKTVAITPADSMTADLAAVPEEDRPEGKRFQDRRRRRPDQAQRRDQRPGRSPARLCHGPVDEDQGRHRQGRLSDQVRRLRHQHGLLGHHRQHRLCQSPTPISSSASCRRRPRRSRPPRRSRRRAAQSILDANPKGGKIDTLTQGFELTIPLYRTPETKAKRPFQVDRPEHDRHGQSDGRIWRAGCQGQGEPEGVLHQRLSAARASFLTGILRMQPAMKTTARSAGRASARWSSDRVDTAQAGIKLSGVSKTYRIARRRRAVAAAARFPYQ